MQDLIQEMVEGDVRAGRWSVLPGEATYKKGQVGPGRRWKCRLGCVGSGINQSLELSDEKGFVGWVGVRWIKVRIMRPEVEGKNNVVDVRSPLFVFP